MPGGQQRVSHGSNQQQKNLLNRPVRDAEKKAEKEKKEMEKQEKIQADRSFNFGSKCRKQNNKKKKSKNVWEENE